MAREIPLTQGLVAIVDDEDFAALSQFKWRARPAGMTAYAVRSEYPSNKTIRMHRQIIGCDGSVDHINGDGLDNRRCNLREATHQQNMRNRRKTPGCSSRHKGVYWMKSKQKWYARIKGNGANRGLGLFSNEDDAARAYNTAAKAEFGVFAKLNEGV